MRVILAAVLILAACGDNRESTLGDYAEALGAAMADKAAACGFETDALNASKFPDRFCAFRDAHDAFLDCAEPIEFDMAPCLDALESIGCVNIGVPENCPSCGFFGLPDECRAMWLLSFHG